MARSWTADGEGRRWRQWTETQAREALEELAASGESLASFARSRGVSPQRIAYWRRRLGEPSSAPFVAVTVPESRAWIEVMVGSVVVRVREDLDVGHVARLVEAIGRARDGAC
jgi:hypothetical protein